MGDVRSALKGRLPALERRPLLLALAVAKARQIVHNPWIHDRYPRSQGSIHEF